LRLGWFGADEQLVLIEDSQFVEAEPDPPFSVADQLEADRFPLRARPTNTYA
jgi:hypothetical protein